MGMVAYSYNCVFVASGLDHLVFSEHDIVEYEMVLNFWLSRLHVFEPLRGNFSLSDIFSCREKRGKET
jgi:hypothetical protein